MFIESFTKNVTTEYHVHLTLSCVIERKLKQGIWVSLYKTL